MNKFENELQSRFRNQKHENDGFDADGLWDDIQSEMDEPLPRQAQVINRSRWIKWSVIVLLGLVLIILLSLKIHSWSNKDLYDSNVAENLPPHEKLATDAAECTQVNSRSNSSTAELQNESESEPKTLAQRNQDIYQETKKSLIGFHAQDENPYSGVEGENIVDQNSRQENLNSTNTSNIYENIFESDPGVNAEAPSHRENQTIVKNEINDQRINRERISIDGLSQSHEISDIYPLTNSNPIQLLSYENERIQDRIPELVAFDKKNFSVETPIDLSINAFYGINAFGLNYTIAQLPQLEDQLNSAHQNYFGSSAGLGLSTSFKGNWSINTGIEYHSLWSKFDHIEVTDTTRFKGNALLRVWLQESTGDTLRQEFGSTHVNVRRTREVVHYNSIKRWSLPIELGWHKDLSKFNLGIQGGLILNFTTSQLGKTLNESLRIIDINTDPQNQPFKSFDISYRLSVPIRYQLSDRFSIDLIPQFTYGSVSNEVLGRIGYRQVNLNLGLRYRLR